MALILYNNGITVCLLNKTFYVKHILKLCTFIYAQTNKDQKPYFSFSFFFLMNTKNFHSTNESQPKSHNSVRRNDYQNCITNGCINQSTSKYNLYRIITHE